MGIGMRDGYGYEGWMGMRMRMLDEFLGSGSCRQWGVLDLHSVGVLDYVFLFSIVGSVSVSG